MGICVTAFTRRALRIRIEGSTVNHLPLPPVVPMTQEKIRAVGAHIFAGSFTVGMSKHFHIDAHLEDGDYGVAAFRDNNPHIPVFTTEEEWPIEQMREMTDVIYGNPPCAPFSSNGAGHRKDHENFEPLEDPRVNCIRQLHKLLKEVQPKFWLFESVTRAYTVGRTLLDQIEDTAVDLGYNVTYFLHDANLHGSPQKRRRFMMMVHDRPLVLDPPDTFESTPLKEFWHRVEDATPVPGPVDRNEFRRKRHEKLIPHLKQGQSLRELYQEEYPGERKGRPLGQVVRLNPNSTTGVLLSGYNWIHPGEDRYLTYNEISALMGYPDMYFKERKGSTGLCSRGVCAEVGDYVGSMIRQSIETQEPMQIGVFEVDYRKKEKVELLRAL